MWCLHQSSKSTYKGCCTCRCSLIRKWSNQTSRYHRLVTKIRILFVIVEQNSSSHCP
jgi:hypothetical protein